MPLPAASEHLTCAAVTLVGEPRGKGYPAKVRIRLLNSSNARALGGVPGTEDLDLLGARQIRHRHVYGMRGGKTAIPGDSHLLHDVFERRARITVPGVRIS